MFSTDFIDCYLAKLNEAPQLDNDPRLKKTMFRLCGEAVFQDGVDQNTLDGQVAIFDYFNMACQDLFQQTENELRNPDEITVERRIKNDYLEHLSDKYYICRQLFRQNMALEGGTDMDAVLELSLCAPA